MRCTDGSNDVVEVRITKDYETAESVGASGTFQIRRIEFVDSKGEELDRTNLVDQGQHYHCVDEVKAELAKYVSSGTIFT